MSKRDDLQAIIDDLHYAIRTIDPYETGKDEWAVEALRRALNLASELYDEELSA